MRNLIAVLAAACLVAAAPSARANTYTVVFDASSSWSQAKAAAVLAGGYLATITSAAEQAAVEAAISAASPAGDGAFWINLRENVECGYVWDNGEPRCYGNFFYGEPNNGFGGTEDRGSLMWSSDLSRRGRWNDVPEAGVPGTGDISRMGYVIEFGPLDAGPACGTYVPVHKASFCNQPPVGSIVVQTQVTGLATGPGLIGRSIIDISQPPPRPPGPQPARTQATYNVSVPVPNGATAALVGTALRDSINSQIGGAGFVANFVSSGNPTLVRMFRASGNYSSSDANSAPGITLSSTSGPPPGGGSGGGVPGPGLSDAGLIALAAMLAVLGGRALRRRERDST